QNNYFRQAVADEETLLQVFDMYISKYPEGKYNEQFESMIYNQAVEQNSVQAFEDYLQRFPNGKYVGEFESVLFNSILQGGSRFTFEDYLQRYPNGNHIGEIELRLLDSVRIRKRVSDAVRYNTLFPDGVYKDTIKSLSENAFYENAVEVNQLFEFKSFMDKYPDSKRIKRITFLSNPEKAGLMVTDIRGRSIQQGETPLSIRAIEGTTLILKYSRKNYKPDSIKYIVKADTAQEYLQTLRMDATLIAFDQFDKKTPWEMTGSNYSFAITSEGMLDASTTNRQHQHLRNFNIDFSKDFILEMSFQFTGQANTFKSYLGFLWGAPQSLKYFVCTPEGKYNFGEQEARYRSGDNENGYSKWNIYSGNQDTWPSTSNFRNNGFNKLVIEKTGNVMIYSINGLNLHQENIFRSPSGKSVGIAIGNTRAWIDYIKIIQ
ncbi:MAG: hypothetical protein JXA03_01975, partial [Bacteroidales bacterium]|nr:hypothetical protein [Bacteroidales bacterium]